MGSTGKITIPEKFEYHRSPDIKEWSNAEEKRSKEITDFVLDKEMRTGDWNEFYEAQPIEDMEEIRFEDDGVHREDAVTVTKFNLVYAQDWDENDRRVKRGKAVTGSTHYRVQTDDGDIGEKFYKTHADAVHAMKLYADEEKQRRAYYVARRNAERK